MAKSLRFRPVLKLCLRSQEEGIVVKAADSPWKLNDRSNNWLKIKPEYVEVHPSVLALISS